MDGCWRTNREPGQAQIALLKSANENCSLSANCSLEEMGPKMHTMPAGVEWGYINK